MTHDPLCPFRPAQTGVCDRPIGSNISCAVLHISQPEVPCQCELIAKVKAKALNDAVEAVTQVPGTTVIPDGDEWHEPFLIERSKVIAAIRDLQVDPRPMTHDLMCPFPFLCLCDFIAKVRANERGES